jgi:polysaccharide pyruvyl transferase WcaK-like protein
VKNIYIGGFGAGNFGDELILSAILKRDPTATIVAYGQPQLDRQIEYIDFHKFMSRAHEILPGHKTLVLGGGGIFWSSEHIQELLIAALLAKNLGIEVQITKVGLHGFHFNKESSHHLLRIADRVSFREHDSLNLARQFLDCNKAIVEPDFACEDISNDRKKPGSRVKIGINIASTRFIDDPLFSNHVRQIYAEIARIFAPEADFSYLPFCTHVTSHNQNDLAKADVLFDASKGLIASATAHLSVDDLLEECRLQDVFIGERFHMHIIAHALGRQFIPLIENDQTKYRALASEYHDIPVFYQFSQSYIIDQLSRRLRLAIDYSQNMQ